MRWRSNSAAERRLAFNLRELLNPAPPPPRFSMADLGDRLGLLGKSGEQLQLGIDPVLVAAAGVIHSRVLAPEGQHGDLQPAGAAEASHATLQGQRGDLRAGAAAGARQGVMNPGTGFPALRFKG